MDYGIISPRDIKKYLNREDVQVIDVRETKSYQELHLKGAISIPYEQLDNYKYSLSKEKWLLLYCDHGSISLRAAKELADEGYRTVTMIGGIMALKEKNFE